MPHNNNQSYSHKRTHQVKEPLNEQDSGKWMITFADLLALLITFFVLLYSMSFVEENNWQNVTRSLSQKLNPNKIVLFTQLSEDKTVTRKEVKSAEALRYLFAVLVDKLNNVPSLKNDVILRSKEDRLIIVLLGDSIFAPAKATLDQGMIVNVFQPLGQALSSIDNEVSIISYTDPRPIKTEQFPSNWELSIERANTIAIALRNAGYANKMIVLGRASSTFDTLLPGVPYEQRLRLARRTEIIIRKKQADHF